MSSALPTLSKTLECVVKQVCLTTHSFELLSTILESVKLRLDAFVHSVHWEPIVRVKILLPFPSLTIKCDQITARVSVRVRVFVCLHMNPSSPGMGGLQGGMQAGSCGSRISLTIKHKSSLCRPQDGARTA